MSARAAAWLALALSGNASGQAASTAPAPLPTARTTWTVARAWCPLGCSATLQRLLKADVGQPVQLSASALTASFIDPCDGQVHLELRATPVADIAADVNKGLPPGHRRLSAASLGATGAPLSGWALCKGAAGDVNLRRLLVVTPERMLLLDEEQALIELR